MSEARSDILTRIHEALSHPLGEDAPEPARPPQANKTVVPGVGIPLVDSFVRALEAVSGKARPVRSESEALSLLAELLRQRTIERAVVVQSGLLEDINVVPTMSDLGIETKMDADWQQQNDKSTLRLWLSEADASVSGVEYAIAETGTLVVSAREGQPRAATLLPPVHIALIGESQIVDSLEMLIPTLRQNFAGDNGTWETSMLTLVSGPSRSADIEQTLSLGVHGPVEVIVIIVADA